MLVDAFLSVATDLLYLRGWGPNVTDDDIGRGSVVLRRLLVEDAYGLAWRAIGMSGQPCLIAVHLPHLIRNYPSRDVLLALAGGARFRDTQGATMCLHRGNVALDLRRPALRPNGYPGEKRYTLRAFLASPSGITRGDVFTRRDVINYIARVQGGVRQWGQRESPERELIERVGSAEQQLIAAGTHGLRAEVFAMGRALADSEDAQTYIERATALTKR